MAVGGEDLDVAALRAREAAVRAELAKIGETPATDPEARKQVTEPRETLASEFKAAAELMERVAGARDAAAALKAEIQTARKTLTELQEKAAGAATLEGVVDETRVKSMETQSAKAAQDVTNAGESVTKLEEALKKRQSDFDGLPARQEELKTRRANLQAELEKTAEDAAQARETLAVQLTTNQVRKGLADLRQAHHIPLMEVDTLRRDLALVQADVARAQQSIADAVLAKARAVRQTQLEEEAKRRELEAQQKLRDAELAATASVKAIKRLEALVGRMETERTQDSKRISELKTLVDEGNSIAQTAATRVLSIQLLYPAGQSLEPWQREGLAEQVRQLEQDQAEFARFRDDRATGLNALLAQALTKSGRLEIFGHRLEAAQDRIEQGENDEVRVAAIERELQHSRDEEYSLWLQARLEFLRGQNELRADEIPRFRAEWDKNTLELKTLVKSRTEDLAEVRSTAKDLRAALDSAAASLDTRSDHLEAITFWLREVSLFSDAHLSAAGGEAADLWRRAGTLPHQLDTVVSEVGERGESHQRRIVAILVFLLVAGFFGLRLRRRLDASPAMTLPIATVGRWGRLGRLFGAVYRHAWLPLALLTAALYAQSEVLGGRTLGAALVALAVAWTAWGLGRGLHRAFFALDGTGQCLAGCEPRTARGAGRALRLLFVGSGVGLALLLVFRAADAPYLARLDVFAWGCLVVLLGAWLVFRHDILTVFLPPGRGGLMASTLRGLLRIVWPLVVLLGAAILVLDALGYATASAFYAKRILWCALAFLALGILHAVLRTFLHRRLLAARSPEDEDLADTPEHLQLVSRFFGGLLTGALLVGLVVTLSLIFDLRWADWDRFGALSLTGGEAGTGLTLGRLLRGLLIFWISLGLARFIRDVVRTVLRARQMHRGSRYVVRTLIFYTLVTLGTLAAISALGVEMTQFGWFLTAAGVGIGFGLQEIISNFICGLILFFERPVQVGDVISVGDVQGDVQQINIRSTVVRTRDGVAIIIPNKKLITEDVVNWSHGEQRTRASITVGVAYGSDVQLVRSTLLEAAEGEERIMKRPEAEVNFLAFGESELTFQLMAWLPTPDPTLRRRVVTSLHMRIDELFRERGVEIPFPQRDLHLRSSAIGSLPKPD